MDLVDIFSIAASAATCLSLLILVPVALLALWQLKESTKLRRMDGLFRAYEWMANEGARRDRGRVYDVKETNAEPDKMCDADREVIARVCVTFDKLGNMASHDLIPQDVFMDSHGDVVYKTWWAAEDYIEQRRKQYRGQFVPHFQNFAQQSLEFMERRDSETDRNMIENMRCKFLHYHGRTKR